MDRAVVIAQLKATQETITKLLSLLESAERDQFASHFYRSRREYRSVCRRAGKGGKQIERCLISTFRVAENIGFNGEFRQLEDLLRVGD